MDANTAATWARNAGPGATSVATALHNGYGAGSLAVAHALVAAGYAVVQVVTAMKDALGLTASQMLALSAQLAYELLAQSAFSHTFSLPALQAAIARVYGPGDGAP